MTGMRAGTTIDSRRWQPFCSSLAVVRKTVASHMVASFGKSGSGLRGFGLWGAVGKSGLKHRLTVGKMKIVHDSVEIIRKEIESWDSPFVELDCFGTSNAERIATIVNEFCQAHLGSNIRGYFFYRASVGSAHGIQLEDGRNVVIKVRPPPETNPHLSFDRKSLEAIGAVMTWLADRSYPCPKLFLGPTLLARGHATVEEFLDHGERGNGFEPACRKTIAAGLTELIELLRSLNGDVSCLKHFQRGNSLYPQPHSKLFDFV
jgi:hypothetical protein